MFPKMIIEAEGSEDLSTETDTMHLRLSSNVLDFTKIDSKKSQL
jgi:hypothetical protein